jgi:hypothetical protein
MAEQKQALPGRMKAMPNLYDPEFILSQRSAPRSRKKKEGEREKINLPSLIVNKTTIPTFLE